MTNLVKPSLEPAWPAAARLIAAWLDRRERIDALMDALPPRMPAVERSRCQHLVFGVVRHAGRIEAALGRLIAHPPRFSTRAVLYLAGFELIEASSSPEEGLSARIVHHAVEQAKAIASPAEARLVNAVMRKMAGALETPVPAGLASAAVLSEYYSHPEWLVSRWLVGFGAEPTRKLLAWNQTPAPVHLRWRNPGVPVPGFLKPTAWPGFYEVPAGGWPLAEPLIRQGQAYAQDPATRLPVDLLSPKAGETLLDLCSSPGGKSVSIADRMGSGTLVSLDLPGSRIDRLKENLAQVHGVTAALVETDLMQGPAGLLKSKGLPTAYSGVLIDVPCSNTGVMRHRIDVKWRLQEADFSRHARQQESLLQAAGRLVAPGGRLVYSTCSIDAAENEQVIKAFLDRNKAFALENQTVAVPWKDGHDGAAAYLLRLNAPSR